MVDIARTDFEMSCNPNNPWMLMEPTSVTIVSTTTAINERQIISCESNCNRIWQSKYIIFNFQTWLYQNEPMSSQLGQRVDTSSIEYGLKCFDFEPLHISQGIHGISTALPLKRLATQTHHLVRWCWQVRRPSIRWRQSPPTPTRQTQAPDGRRTSPRGRCC